MELERRFKEIVRESYNLQALLYKDLYLKEGMKTRVMQLDNLRNLSNFLLESGVQIKEGRFLDAGCGNAIGARIVLTEFRESRVEYLGIDSSHEMIKVGKEASAELNLVEGDLECLPFRDDSFIGGISNSVLHWLNIPEIGKSPKQALGEIYRVLKSGAPFALSVSGYGTAGRFQQSYREVIGRVETERPDNYSFKRDLYREDPIGSMHLKDLTAFLTEAGFKIVRGVARYEPVIYERPEDYVDAVKAYGYGTYLASISDDMKQEVWEQIKNNFVEKIGQGPYEHDQYMIYVVAVKPEKS